MYAYVKLLRASTSTDAIKKPFFVSAKELFNIYYNSFFKDSRGYIGYKCDWLCQCVFGVFISTNCNFCIFFYEYL